MLGWYNLENCALLFITQRTEELESWRAGRGQLDVNCCEGGRGKGGTGEEKDDDMAECGERGDGKCVLGRGDGEWGCEDGAGGEDDAEWGRRDGGHWRLCGRNVCVGVELGSIGNGRNDSPEADLLRFNVNRSIPWN